MGSQINILKFDTEARKSLQRGMNVVADAVSATLGPRGHNVSIERPARNLAPLVLHDGVSVARSINLKDPFENMGAQLLKEAAIETNDVAGDGTTTSTILAQAIANRALEAGGNSMVVKKEIEDSLKVVLKELDKLAKKIETDEEIEQVATISSADPELGKLVAEALSKVGKDGVVTVEEGKGFDTTVEYKQGMEIDRGYLSPYFVTDQDTVEASIEDPFVLLTDKKLNYAYQVVPFLEKFVKAGHKNLVIIAGEVVEEAMAALVINRLRGVVNVVAIQAPAFGGRRVDELGDLAVLMGATPLLEESGRELDSFELEELGQAGKVVSDRDKTVITDGKGNPEEIEKRIEHIRKQIEIANTEYDKDIKKQRLAKMAGGVAVINVGAVTEPELKEKKERVIDAVNATKAAISEGIVAGGEITLLTLSKLGEGILYDALKQPFKRLIENSGMDYADIREQMAGKNYPFGVDVIDGKVKDLIKAGVIDPVKVTRSALENAVSVACLVLTTNVAIVDDREEK